MGRVEHMDYSQGTVSFSIILIPFCPRSDHRHRSKLIIANPDQIDEIRVWTKNEIDQGLIIKRPV